MKHQTDSDWINDIIDFQIEGLRPLRFRSPVHSVYNPLTYARQPYARYWQQYGLPPKECIFLGMNPGPWGMAQTGVPFGDVSLVTQWLGICGQVTSPSIEHPKKPVLGFNCPRSEISGQRLWGWARQRFKDPAFFFKRFWVANYCPLVFMEESGRNLTPDKLAPIDKKKLFEVCDRALRWTVRVLKPRFVVGVGVFAARRAAVALADMPVIVGQIAHPSPANPKANRGWSELVEKELDDLGIKIPA
jgi:single-strand selective monofunctional uracil DNA glycosylase